MGDGAQQRGKRRRVAEEKFVLDQCALFALRQALSGVQGREVSAGAILEALRTAGEWAKAHHHDARSREEGQVLLDALDRGGALPPISLGLMHKCSVELGTSPLVSSVLMGALTLMLYTQGSAWQRSTTLRDMARLKTCSPTRRASH
jgi:hypothetical protein